MRYLLDTNVVSEGLKNRPDQRILKKMHDHEGEMAIASVVWHELVFGAVRAPSAGKRSIIELYLYDVIHPNIPILPYDERAAWWHAQERARLSGKGEIPPFADGQIAAIARTNGLVLVTRNTRDFVNFDRLQLENWAE